jgi:hypothetical protein
VKVFVPLAGGVWVGKYGDATGAQVAEVVVSTHRNPFGGAIAGALALGADVATWA